MEKCNRLISHLAFPIDYRLFQLIVPPLTVCILNFQQLDLVCKQNTIDSKFYLYAYHILLLLFEIEIQI